MDELLALVYLCPSTEVAITEAELRTERSNTSLVGTVYPKFLVFFCINGR